MCPFDLKRIASGERLEDEPEKTGDGGTNNQAFIDPKTRHSSVEIHEDTEGEFRGIVLQLKEGVTRFLGNHTDVTVNMIEDELTRIIDQIKQEGKYCHISDERLQSAKTAAKTCLIAKILANKLK